MPTALSTIAIAKEQAATYQPLLLAEFTFYDGSVLRLSTHPLNATEGGYQYGGNDYLGRLNQQDIAQVQALSDTGIDLIPSVTLRISDPDGWVRTNYGDASGKGFKGAKVKLTLIFGDIEAGNFSSDSHRKFDGICDMHGIDGEYLSVTANSKTSLTRQILPTVPMQRRCPLINPITAAQRSDASNPDSPYYPCGETRSLATAPACSYTKETCTQANRRANITWDPPSTGSGREYISGGTVNFKNIGNSAVYGDYVPLIYGMAWVEPPIVNVVGDGNYTRGEAVLCFGQISDIYRCVVNDTEISPTNRPDRTAYGYVNKDFRYAWINDGRRDGLPNTDAPYNSQGDPYGNLAAIQWLVPRAIAEAGSKPRLRCLVRGRLVRVYTDVSTYTTIWSDNPVWIILDILILAGWNWADIDLATFITAAAFCDAYVTYTDQNGNSATRYRARASLVIRERKSAAEITRGLLQNFGGLLLPNTSTGKIQLIVRRTLADQQPSPVTGSNYNSPVTSKTIAGVTTNGYVAYKFTPAEIVSRAPYTSLRLPARPSSDLPNRVSFPFSDAEYSYAQSSLSIVDSDDVARMDGQEIGGSPSIAPLGITTYDQAIRRARVLMAEALRGNAQADPRGTVQAEWETSVRGEHLRVGDIVMIDEPYRGLSNQLVRVTKIQPSQNYETIKLFGNWHIDDWYTDAFGQANGPQGGSMNRGRKTVPMPWMPNAEAPIGSDSLYPSTKMSFAVYQQYDVGAGNAPLPMLRIVGREPVNVPSPTLRPPSVPIQGTTATTGGALAGDRVYWLALSAKDANGLYSSLSERIRVDIPSGTSTNTATISGISWASGSTGYRLYAGTDPFALALQAEVASTPANITLSAALQLTTGGAPDTSFDHLEADVVHIIHAGLWGAVCGAVTTTTIQVVGAGWTTDQWIGYDVSVLAKAVSTNPVPIASFRVTANTADTLTFAVNPAAAGVASGDVIVMRSKPTISNGGKTFTDALWQNSIYPGGMNVGEEVGRILRIIAGTGAGQSRRITANTATSLTVSDAWDTMPDSTSRYIIEEASVVYGAVQTPQMNSDSATWAVLFVPVENMKGQCVRVSVYTADSEGTRSPDVLAPIRELYVFGQALTVPTISVSANTTLTAQSQIVLVDASGGARTITLPSAASMVGLRITVKKIDSSANTVTLSSADNIDGTGTYVLSAQNEFVTVEGVA